VLSTFQGKVHYKATSNSELAVRSVSGEGKEQRSPVIVEIAFNFVA
jgi:hypothetical protein